MKKYILALLFIISFIPFSYSKENIEKINIFAENCSKVSIDEQLAKARLRAQDIALFQAISNLKVLELPKKEFNQYDFNKLVYNLSDNYVQDLKTETISQDSKKICINISGYIKTKDLLSSIIETKSNSDARALDDQRKEISQNQYEIPEDIFEDISYDIERIKENINIDDIDISQGLGLENIDTKDILTEAKYDNIIEIKEPKIEKIKKPLSKSDQAKIYISSTQFYNGLSSKEHSKIVENEFKENPLFTITNEEEVAQYILNPNILRVKVDKVNEETNRLQMVIMIEMKDLIENSTTKEYQNRFTIFSNDDNEQVIAKDLMEKLISKATSQIIKKMENKEKKRRDIRILPSIITPDNF